MKVGTRIIRGDHRRRFESKCRPMGECIEWVGQRSDKGYGVFWDGRSERKAHVWAWEQASNPRRPVPAGLELDHVCRNRWCVNPDHLEPVTHAENMRRASEALTHCKRGHAYVEHGYRRKSDGRRMCRLCDSERRRGYRLRTKALTAATALGRLAAGEPPTCTYPGCHDTRLSADPDGGAGGLCIEHGGIK